MKNRWGIALIILIFVVGISLTAAFVRTHDIALFSPKGSIALEERNLMAIAVGLMFLAVIPVFIATIYIARKYREGNTKAEYTPDRGTNPLYQFMWFGFTCAIIFVLAVITWKSTHMLDPYKPIVSNVPPIQIQVVALQWKWLFIYPEERIATMNFVQFPEDTPVHFELTADAPMSSFWIPQLGGQIYAMTGMSTPLYLIADEAGDYTGRNAEISGAGFAGMQFTARASSRADFDAWVNSARASARVLDAEEYARLAKPSENEPVAVYAAAEDNIYNQVIAKFMPALPAGRPASPAAPEAMEQTMPIMMQ